MRLFTSTEVGAQVKPSLAQNANGKESDLIARFAAEEVFFEIKFMRESQGAEALSQLTMALMMAMSDVVRPLAPDLQFQVQLFPEVSMMMGAGPSVDAAVIHGLVEQVKQSVTHHLRSGTRNFVIEHVGAFRFDTSDKIPQSGLSFPVVHNGMEERRIMQARVPEAVKQLPPDKPGIIVLSTESGLDEDHTEFLVRSFLASPSSEAAHVSAVVFLPVFHALPTRWSRFKAFAVKNPVASFPAMKLRAFRDFEKECSIT